MPRSLWSSRTNLYLPTHLPIMHKFLFPTKKWFVSVPLFPLSSFSSSSVWPDLAIFCHFWQQVKKNWQLFEDLISIWQNFEPTMENPGSFWTNFIVVNGQILSKYSRHLVTLLILIVVLVPASKERKKKRHPFHLQVYDNNNPATWNMILSPRLRQTKYYSQDVVVGTNRN